MTTRKLVSLTLIVLAAGSISAAERSEVPWRTALTATYVDGSGQGSIQPTRSVYEVDMLGPTAIGVLSQEFTNQGAAEAKVRYVSQAPPGMSVARIEAHVDGESFLLSTGQPRRVAQGPKQSSRSAQKRLEKKEVDQLRSEISLEAGASVIVEVSFERAVPFRDARFQLVLPAVDAIASRPGEAESEVGPTPTSFPPPVEIVVRVHHDEPLLVAESPTHEVFVSFEGTHSRVELTRGASSGRTFEMAIGFGHNEDEPELIGFVGPETKGTRDLMVVLSPPVAPRDESVRPKQVLFVLDGSGSMAGNKIEEAKKALVACLDRLNPEDSLNLVRFSTEHGFMEPEPVEASAAAVSYAKTWLLSQTAGGSTKMFEALAETLSQPEDAELHRMVVILTDGAVQDLQPALKLLETALGDARLFVVGIGADVREESIRALAEYGRGTAALARDPGQLTAAVAEMFDSVSDPLAWNVEIAWGGVDVKKVTPERIPDLYAGRPVTISAKVSGELPEELNVLVETMDGPREFTARLATPENVTRGVRRP